MHGTAPDAVAAVRIRNLSMSFGGTRALDAVDLDIRPGEVHGLVGQNGSGKSTLIKVLSGYNLPEPGTVITVAGEDMPLPLRSADTQRLGLRFVHQDLGLVPQLSVVENLFVDELARRDRWFIRWPAERDRARRVFETFGRAIDPSARVGDLSAADQAHLAIVRAVDQLRRRHAGQDPVPGLLVLDEATAFLSGQGKRQLFGLVREVVARGDAVLFVSHYLDEVLEIADQVTVLRDGRVVSTLPGAELDAGKLVELIIGRDLAGGTGPARALAASETLVEVSGLTSKVIDEVSFGVHDGEVLGLTGLLGSGFEEVPNLVFGSTTARSGTLRIGDETFDLAGITPHSAAVAGIAFVPRDRGREGGAGSLTVAENLTLQVLDRYLTRARMLRKRQMLRDARQLLEEFDVRPPDPHAKLSELSGGNQQKVVMAKWLFAEPRLLLLHEPTQGVDVGSRAEILDRIRRAARAGMAVVCASADPEQLSDLCDRVLVFGRGRIRSELGGQDIDKDRIVEHCYTAAA
ncbi:MAG: sugar ABC transporter ATP-binding protein [Acidimicrobiales bacterium]